MPSLFATQFASALKEVTSSDYGNRRLVETQTQGLGHLTRLFDEIAFTAEAATQAYDQSINTDNSDSTGFCWMSIY